MKDNATLKTPTEQIIKENEILGKILLEIIWNYRNFTHPHEFKSDEEIKELLSNEDWKERSKFWITWVEYDKDYWVSYKTVSRHQIKPQNIVKLLRGVITNCEDRMAEQTAEIKRLKKSEEQLEDLKKKVVEIMLEYYEPRHYGTAEEIVNNDNSRTKELVAEIKTNEQIKEVISLIIDSWKEDATSHIKAIETSEKWNKKIAKELREEIRDNSKLLKKEHEKNAIYETKIKELEAELNEQKKLLEREYEKNKIHRQENQELRKQLNFSNKPLSKKRKKQEVESQQMAKKAKVQNQLIVAQIEIKKQ